MCGENIKNVKGSVFYMSTEEMDLDYEPDIITLIDENDEEHVFEVIDATDFNDERYLAVVPYAQDSKEFLEENASLLIMKVNEVDGEEFLDVVEDDEEFYNVSNIFAKRLEEFYELENNNEE